MRNEPNFSKSQMFITLIRTTNYNKKWTMDTWSKRTQTNPILPAFYPPKAGWRVCPQRGRAAIVARTNLRLISLCRKFTEGILWFRFVRRRIGRLHSLWRLRFRRYPVFGIEPGSQVDKFAPLRAKREEFILSG